MGKPQTKSCLLFTSSCVVLEPKWKWMLLCDSACVWKIQSLESVSRRDRSYIRAGASSSLLLGCCIWRWSSWEFFLCFCFFRNREKREGLCSEPKEGMKEGWEERNWVTDLHSKVWCWHQLTHPVPFYLFIFVENHFSFWLSLVFNPLVFACLSKSDIFHSSSCSSAVLLLIILPFNHALCDKAQINISANGSNKLSKWVWLQINFLGVKVISALCKYSLILFMFVCRHLVIMVTKCLPRNLWNTDAGRINGWMDAARGKVAVVVVVVGGLQIKWEGRGQRACVLIGWCEEEDEDESLLELQVMKGFVAKSCFVSKPYKDTSVNAHQGHK